MSSIPHRSPNRDEPRRSSRRSRHSTHAGGGWQFLDRTLGDEVRFRRLLLLGLLIALLAAQPSAVAALADTAIQAYQEAGVAEGCGRSLDPSGSATTLDRAAPPPRPGTTEADRRRR
jgi:hypothetical protein